VFTGKDAYATGEDMGEVDRTDENGDASEIGRASCRERV